jgi:hypothetical protein
LGEAVGKQGRQESDRPSGGDKPAEDEAVIAAMADVGLKSAEAVADVADHRVESRAAVARRPDRGLTASERERAAPGERWVFGVQSRENLLA